MKSIKNKYIFFLSRILKDIFNPRVWTITKELHSQELKQYYFIFTEQTIANQKGGQKSVVINKNGIPENLTYIDVTDKESVYFPITIGQMGLAVFHTYLQTKSEQDKKRFLKFVDWYYDNADENEELGVRWLTDVSLPQYKNFNAWQSAFSQSRGISILLRGYQITGKNPPEADQPQAEKYSEMAEKALIPFTKSVEDGGVTSFTKWGPFYEEYTAEVPTLVLNGMIFALCGIYDFRRVFPENKLAKKIFDDGILTLKNILPKYDLGYWSRYNLCKADWYPKIDPATISYQRLHITQLLMLHKLTGENIFAEYAEKFRKQDTLFNVLKMYFVKYKALKKLGRL